MKSINNILRNQRKERYSILGTTERRRTKDIYNTKYWDPHEEMRAANEAYMYNALFQAAVNSLKMFITGGELKITSKNEFTKLFLQRKIDEGELDITMDEIVESCIKTGNGYLEIEFNPHTGVPEKWYPIADASRIYINCDEFGRPIRKILEDGRVIENEEEYYLQEVSQTYIGPNVHWYKISYYTGTQFYYKTIKAIPIPRKNIVHFMLNLSDNAVYGRSFLAASLNDDEILREIERSLAIIAKFKAVPRKIIQYGDGGFNPQDEELKDFVNYIENLEPEENIIITKPFVMSDLSYSGKDVNLSYMIDHIKKKIVAGLSPEFLVGIGDETNRATAKEQLVAYVLQVMTLRKRFIRPLLKNIIKPILEYNNKITRTVVEQTRLSENDLLKEGIGLLDPNVGLEFGELDFETKAEKVERVTRMWQSDEITYNEMRKGLGYHTVKDEKANLSFSELRAKLIPDQMQNPMGFQTPINDNEAGIDGEDKLTQEPISLEDKKITQPQKQSLHNYSFKETTTLDTVINWLNKNPKASFRDIQDWAIENKIDLGIAETAFFGIVKKEALDKPSLGRDLPDKEFDQTQLSMGTDIEGEHTTDPMEAKKTAKDHLVEDPQYYTHLKQMEDEYKDKKKEDISSSNASGITATIIAKDIKQEPEPFKTIPLKTECLICGERHQENLSESLDNFPKNATGTDSITKKYTEQLNKVYSSTEKGLIKNLETHKEKYQKNILTEATLGSDFLNYLSSLISRITSKIKPISDKNVKSSYKKGFDDTKLKLNTGKIKLSNEKIDQAIKQHSEVMNTYNMALRKRLLSLLSTGITQGHTIKEVASDIKKAFHTTQARANTIARSEMIKAYNNAVIDTMKENGLGDSKVKWITARDDSRCRGKAFSLSYNGEEFTNCRSLNNRLFDVKDAPIPVEKSHFNCRCSLTPQKKVWTTENNLKKEMLLKENGDENKEGKWVTIKGKHVFIDNNGNIIHGGYKQNEEPEKHEDIISAGKILRNIEENMPDNIREKLNFFEQQNDEWLASSDYESKQNAFDYVTRDFPELGEELRKAAFGENPPEQLEIYRVGGISGITSFFPNKEQAEEYAKRDNISDVDTFIADTDSIIPTFSGSGELWINVDEGAVKRK